MPVKTTVFSFEPVISEKQIHLGEDFLSFLGFFAHAYLSLNVTPQSRSSGKPQLWMRLAAVSSNLFLASRNSRKSRNLRLFIIRGHSEKRIVQRFSLDAGHFHNRLRLAVFDLGHLERERAAFDEFGEFGIGVELRFDLIAHGEVFELIENSAGPSAAEIAHPFRHANI